MLLEAHDLTVRYGRRTALDRLNVSIDSKALGLLGPNGAGKSTLIRTMLGLVSPANGKTLLEGLDARAHGKRIRELIGYMPEHESYLGGMTVIRFLRFMGEMCGLGPSDAMERAHEVLFYVGLGEVRYRPVDGLSYGMKQKVRLAQALIHGPGILILDEPTNGLDPEGREEMLSLLREMIEQSQSKVIVSSHLLRDIESCCHDVLVLKQGRVVASGNIEAMKNTDTHLLELRIKGALDDANATDRFMGALSEIGCDCRMNHQETIQITLPDGMVNRRIFELAHAHGIQLRHFYAKRDTLEDIFLKVLEDEAPEPENTGGS